MTEKTCGGCAHFRRHYIRYKSGRYMPLFDGHCVFPRLKPRKTDTRACEHFMAAADSAEA